MGPGEDIRDRQRERASVVQLILLGIVASAIGIALALLIDWFPTPASIQAGPIDTLWDVLLIASVPIFVLVQAVVLYCVWKFRMRPGQEQQDGAPIHGNTRLEVLWTVIPAILILGLCTYAYVVLTDIEEAQANEMTINVTGQQFSWTFEYGEGDEAVRTTELYLPEDQPVLFRINSLDVIHSFWVPEFRMKIDAVPGIATEYRITANRRGTYPVVCAELCGVAHAFMRQTARVVTREEFDRIMQERRQAGAPGESEEAGAGAPVDGRTLFTDGNGQSAACGNCHTLSDAGTESTTGPDLDEAMQGKSEEELRRDIVDPGAQTTPGFSPGIMPPNYGQVLTDRELDALVDYLMEAAG
jgi:cytochrome c oxidase subunit II